MYSLAVVHLGVLRGTRDRDAIRPPPPHPAKCARGTLPTGSRRPASAHLGAGIPRSSTLPLPFAAGCRAAPGVPCSSSGRRGATCGGVGACGTPPPPPPPPPPPQLGPSLRGRPAPAWSQRRRLGWPSARHQRRHGLSRGPPACRCGAEGTLLAQRTGPRIGESMTLHTGRAPSTGCGVGG